MTKNINEDHLGLVDFIEGIPLFIHIVGDSIFATRKAKDSNLTTRLSPEEEDKCRALMHLLKLKVGQIIFTEHPTQGKIFANLSPYPNWEYSAIEHQERIFA